MKLFILSLSILSCFSLHCDPDFSVAPDAIAVVDNLVKSTQRSLEEQKLIQKKLYEYAQYRELVLLDDENKALVCELISAAEEVLGRIEESHLTPYFQEDILRELKFFSQIAHKTNQITAP